MKLYTIGFTKKSAERFFGLLRDAGVQRVIDIRLNNTSQLASFAKRDDLEYFLREIAGIDYMHEPLLAPTQEILTAYRSKDIAWPEFHERFRTLIDERKIERKLDPGVLDRGCLLCSEHEPDHCHRSVIVEYLRSHWDDVDVEHLE